MSLTHKSLTGLYGGVSQQSPELRLENQCEALKNCEVSISKNLEKRFGSELLMRLDNTLMGAGSWGDGAVISEFVNSEDEQYLVVFTGDSDEPVEVYDVVDATKRPVHFRDTATKTYLSSGSDSSADPIDYLKTASTLDHMLIANTSVEASLTSDTSHSRDEYAVVWVKTHVVYCRYNITVDGTTVGISGSSGGNSYDDTKDIAGGLATQVNGVAGFTATSEGSLVKIYKTAGGSFDISVADGYGGSGLELIYKKVESLSDLPEAGFEDQLVEISGSDSNDFTNYYVQFDPDENVWSETIGFDLQYSLDPSTLPHRLIRLPDGSFWVGPLDQNDEMNLLLYSEDLENAAWDCSESGGGAGDEPSVTDTPDLDDYPNECFEITWPTLSSDGGTIGYFEQVIPASEFTDAGTVMVSFWADINTDFIVEALEWTGAAVGSSYDTYDIDLELDQTGYGDEYVEWRHSTFSFSKPNDSYGVVLRFYPYGANSAPVMNLWLPQVAFRLSSDDLDGILPFYVKTTSAAITAQESDLDLYWNDREVGDDDSCGQASFIGNTINGLFFYKNRFGILSGAALCLSQAGDMFNFWNQTALDVLDDDPIDIELSANQGALCAAVPYQENILVFAPGQQFVLTAGGDALSPKTVAADLVTAYEAAADCEPKVLGPNVYFPVETGFYSQIREMYTEADTLIQDAADITAHIPTYIPCNIKMLAASPKYDTLFCFTQGLRNELYVYRQYWRGNEKIQSAWGKWILDEELYGSLISINVLLGELYAVIRFGDEAYLLKFHRADTAYKLPPIHIPPICLDAVYGPITGVCYNGEPAAPIYKDGSSYNIQLPFESTPDRLILIGKYSDGGTKYKVIESEGFGTIYNGTYYHASFEYDGNNYTEFYAGLPYESYITLSEPVLKQGDVVVSGPAEIKLRRARVHCEDTGDLSVIVTDPDGDELEDSFNAVDDGQATGYSTWTGRSYYRYPLLCGARESTVQIGNSTALPFRVTSVDLELLTARR